MGRSEVDAVLARLVAQFASPYDFLRELVQNSMDAGSDRVEVTLERHDDAHGSAVFELSVVDTGVGMDESIIDGALTRLFSSSKADDRTMAGGFGVGFVSIFAWEPELVLLQTGRGGEAWELIFHEDRRFEKHRLDVPVEGTTITMFRRGDAGVYPSVVEAVRDSLWRWCRYCPLEVSFEDLNADDGPELIQDAPAREEQVLAQTEAVGDGEVRVAFGVPSHATLLRRGLILAEGAPGAHIEALRDQGQSVDHLQLWIDSPELETTLARDKVVESQGRERLETRVLAALDQLRERLLQELVELANDPGPFTLARAQRYATLHAHLQLEWAQLGPRARQAPILRRVPDRSGQLGISPQALAEAVGAGPVLWRVDFASAPHPLAGAYPVLALSDPADATWLAKLGAHFAFEISEANTRVGRIEPLVPDDQALVQLGARTEALLARAAQGHASTAPRVRVAAAVDADDTDPPLAAWRLGDAALTSRDGLPNAALGDLWLDARHLIVKAALQGTKRAPRAALAALASALCAVVDTGVPPKALADALEGEAAQR